jgi:hypothetical protein
MRAMTGRLGTGLCTLAFLLAAGCGAADVIANNTDSPSPSGGVASLQTAPYNDAGQPTHAPPVQIPPPAALGGEVLDFTSIAANFDPNIQRFVWVLPPGVHGEAPWGFTAQVRHKGEVKYEAELPLVAQMVAAGSRPEYTAGYEIIRLTDDGRWSERTAAMDKVILALIEQHGRGDGEVEFSNKLNLSLDAAAKQAYCTEGKTADIRLYVEEEGEAEIIPMLDVAQAAFSRMAVQHACEG